jgi:carbamoyltransferase
MFYLGISPEHDSSVCVFKDNQIVYFSKEERFSKLKRDNFPMLSILNSFEKYPIEKIVWCSPFENMPNIYANIFSKKTKNKKLEILELNNHHHLQHASLAFYNSGFDKACIIVIDRNGSLFSNFARESETIFFANYPAQFQEIYKSFWSFGTKNEKEIYDFKSNNLNCEIEINSILGITKVYETATNLIGQHVLENGKTMGLAPYGKDDEKFPKLFLKNIPNDYYFGHCEEENRPAVFIDLESKKTKNIDKKNYKIYADYAFQVQKQTQEAVCHLIQKAIDKTGCKNICITGGYGLNVVANQHYISQFPDVNFYFEPLADDSGNSIGGAMLAYRTDTQDKTISKIKNTFFQGEKYKLDNVKGKKVSIKEISNILKSQKSLAIYYGLAEAGPRALGHRSILFDARNPNAKELINKVKNREWYRPFAGIMLEEDAEKYFYVNDKKNYEFMTVNFYAKDIAKIEIPGILHVDNTCRIQVIKDESEPVFELLKQFKKDTGIGVLLNTSFNLAGMPLVETPEDAIWTLSNSELDHIWFSEINTLV